MLLRRLETFKLGFLAPAWSLLEEVFMVPTVTLLFPLERVRGDCGEGHGAEDLRRRWCGVVPGGSGGASAETGEHYSSCVQMFARAWGIDAVCDPQVAPPADEAAPAVPDEPMEH